MTSGSRGLWWDEYAHHVQDNDVEMLATGQILPWETYKEGVVAAKAEGIDTSASREADVLEAFLLNYFLVGTKPDDPFLDEFVEEL